MKSVSLKNLLVLGMIALSIPFTVCAQTETAGGSSGNGDGDLAIMSQFPSGLTEFQKAYYLFERSSLPSVKTFQTMGNSAINFSYFEVLDEVQLVIRSLRQNAGTLGQNEGITATVVDIGELGQIFQISFGNDFFNKTPTIENQSMVVEDKSQKFEFRQTPAGRLIVVERTKTGKCFSSKIPVQNICAITYVN